MPSPTTPPAAHGHAHTPWTVCVQDVKDTDEAKAEMARLVDGTPHFTPRIYILMDGEFLCPAVTGCGARSEENAHRIATAVNSHASLLAALEEIADAHVPDQPASSGLNEADYVREHVARLRRIARAALERARA